MFRKGKYVAIGILTAVLMISSFGFGYGPGGPGPGHFPPPPQGDCKWVPAHAEWVPAGYQFYKVPVKWEWVNHHIIPVAWKIDRIWVWGHNKWVLGQYVCHKPAAPVSPSSHQGALSANACNAPSGYFDVFAVGNGPIDNWTLDGAVLQAGQFLRLPLKPGTMLVGQINFFGNNEEVQYLEPASFGACLKPAS